MNSIIEFGNGRITSACGGARGRNGYQPKCYPQVCEKGCPYCHFPWRVDIVDIDGERDAVVLSRDKDDGALVGCAIMYLNGKGNRSEIETNVGRYMRRHAPRLMEDCPFHMEHELYGWNNGRATKRV